MTERRSLIRYALVAAFGLLPFAAAAQSDIIDQQMKDLLDFQRKQSKPYIDAKDRVEDYYRRKKQTKQDHPSWTPDQVSRFGVCLVGLKIGIDSLIEKDERVEVLRKNTALCESYAVVSK